ncbi:MAG: SusC/RagA family TonB-linked outer membrane protein [Bacteroidetes bacterium GWF2_42_66]|nr:MAG: SusC/RagA family TonB-linked outer membrane protein [Bacteroidetes bacterium GWE2_42_39]OFY39808.1 MAG: SusC/RagA family TonB-linked outer membrane protein [Bacteroidetes bacterium GWF2_42_66]
MLYPKDENAGASQQQKTITGKVADSSGAPLPGVTVVVKGTTNGTITDTDGKYSLPNVASDAVLVFSFVGMRSQEISVAGKTSVYVRMDEESIGIEEVVAVGYGTQKKANLTGAVSMATSERLENRPIVAAGQGLQGVIPNLNISIRNGDPTESADYNIRGFESINGGSPLILVDGVPMDLESINPNDIKSVSVLKDASAAAIYGARAAFGVVLVETKQGAKGKVNVTFSTEQSLAKPICLLDIITNPYDYVTLRNQASIRTSGQPAYDDDYAEGTRKWVENPTEENAWGVVNGVLRFYGNNNFRDRIITDFSPQEKYDMTVSGASDKASYFVSFGYLNKDGYLKMSDKNEKFKRYNVLMKADFKINNWLSLDEKIVFNAQMSDKPNADNYDLNSIVRITPIQMIEFPDLDYYLEPGDHDKYAQYIGMYTDGTILPYLNSGRKTYTTNDTWLTQGITITPLKGLKFRGDFSYNTYHKDYQMVVSKVDVISSSDLTAKGMVTNGETSNDFIENQANYNQYYVFNTYGEYTFDKFSDHYLKAMVGFNQEWGRNTYINAKAQSLLTPSVTDLNATIGTQYTKGGKSHVAIRGVFYRLNYSYKDKYLLETNGRYDGTSRFPKDSRFGFFPSLSLGWRMSNEPFMEGTKNWLDNLKIRASYGELGNQLLSDFYPYITTMGSGLSNYIMSAGQTPYVSASGLVSPSLTWEKVATQNIGLDVALFGQRLDISADAYIRDTKDMLMNVEYPDILGTDAPRENAADLQTKGWELSVTWHDKIGQDWQYRLNLALADNTSEITKYENPTGALSEYYVGQKIGDIWGYVTQGIFQTDEEVASAADQSQLGSGWLPGDIHYADLNDDEKITAGSNTLADPGDRKIIGNSTARYSFGINPELKYKNWSLNIFFQGLFRDYLPGNGSWNTFYPFNIEAAEKYFLTETWNEDNRDAYFAAPHLASHDKKNVQPQSRYVQNAAYIRLKNLTLNYNLPQMWINKVGLNKAQIYFSGMNLCEYTKMHKPLDPESTYTVAQEYFLQRIFTLGVKVTF